MRAVHLVADSTCDIPAAEAAAMELTIVPLKVIIGEEVFADGVDIDPATLYARMRGTPVAPRTSQPTPAEFEEAFRRLGGDSAPIVCTTISSAISGTYGAAQAACAALPDLDIRLVDTRTVGPAHRQVVEALVAAADGGAGPDELEAVAQQVIASQRLVFTVETLEYLRRGGRIGGARALLGSMLNIKPILEFRDGVIEPVDRVRTFPRALDRVLDEMRSAAASWDGRIDVLVTHADLLEPARDLARRAGEVTGAEPRITECGPVIGCHGGPGAIGLSFYRAVA